MVIASVGDDEQGASAVACIPHLAQAEVDGIEQCGAAAGDGKHHAILELLGAGGESAGQFSAVVKSDEKEFIARIRRAQELNGGLAGFIELACHASAHIEDQTDGNGNIFAGEGGNLLLDAVFVDLEVFLIEPGDRVAKGIGDAHIDERHIDIHLDGGLVGVRLLRFPRNFRTGNVCWKRRHEDKKSDESHVYPLSVTDCHHNSLLNLNRPLAGLFFDTTSIGSPDFALPDSTCEAAREAMPAVTSTMPC